MPRAELNPSYILPRLDVAALVPASAETVLDVGCSVGAVGAAIKERTGARVVGIELDSEMASAARLLLDHVHVGDVEEILRNREITGPFDCVLFADLLEHLRDPWSVMKTTRSLLSDDGVVVVSLPNIRHYTTILNLLRGRWPYRERGIHDRTHLRFFTLHTIRELFSGAGFRILRIKRKYRIMERPHPINVVARIGGFWPLREFLTFQYIVVASNAGS